MDTSSFLTPMFQTAEGRLHTLLLHLGGLHPTTLCQLKNIHICQSSFLVCVQIEALPLLASRKDDGEGNRASTYDRKNRLP
jgi:hypothetical protein